MSFDRVQLGDSVTLYKGDCLEVMPTLASGCVDSVVTDPQFFCPAVHYSSRTNWGRAWADLSPLQYWFAALAEQSARITNEAGSLLAFCDSQSYPVFFAGAYSHWDNCCSVVWDKGRIGMGSPWRKQHELILACSKSGSRLTDTSGTVLKFSIVPHAERMHPAQKPVALVQRLVELVSQPRGSSLLPTRGVIDPFMGSGTTGEACVLADRPFIGIEKEDAYFSKAVARIEAALAQRAEVVA